MQCPNCRTENPNDAQLCTSCGCNLTAQHTTEPTPKPKTSKMALVSSFLAALAAALMLFVAPPLGFLPAVLSVLTAVASIVEIRRSNKRLIGKSLAIAAIIFSTLVILVLSCLSIDADPLPYEYTIADLRSAEPEYAQSYRLLQSLAGPQDQNAPGAPTLGLSQHDLDTIYELHDIIKETDYSGTAEVLSARADEVTEMWQRALTAREIVDHLGSFDQIADLSSPDFNLLDETMSALSLIDLGRLYQCYVMLLASRGDNQHAVEELIRFDSVFRKLSVNARDLIVKMSCFAIFSGDIYAGAFIVNHPQTSNESLQFLERHFTHLTDIHLSLRNPILFQSLQIEHFLKLEFAKSNGAWKPNSTLRLIRNFVISQLEMVGELQQNEQLVSVWPRFYPGWLPRSIGSQDANLPSFYILYNPMGSIFGAFMDSVEGKYEHSIRLRILDDLLRILLNKRLGKPVSLEAHAYTDEYIIDIKNRRIFSPGPDGEAETKDDIELPIDPNVVDFTSEPAEKPGSL